MTITVRPWPEVQRLLPPLSTAERAALAASIARDGVKVPLQVLTDGRIVDGHHRWELSRGTAPIAEPLDLPEDRAFALAIALNIARRQMSGEQIAAIREQLKRDKGVQHETAKVLREQGKSQAETAAIVGVTQQAIDVWESGNNTNNGIVSPPDYRLSIPREERPRIVARAADGEKTEQIAADYKVTPKRIRQIVRQAEPVVRADPSPVRIMGLTLAVADAADLPLADQSINLTVTSPPYGLGVSYAFSPIETDVTEECCDCGKVHTWHLAVTRRALEQAQEQGYSEMLYSEAICPDCGQEQGYTIPIPDGSRDWIRKMTSWLQEIYRVTCNHGRLAINIPLDTTYGWYRPTYAQTVQVAVEIGWHYRSTIVWNEGNINKSVARGSMDSSASPHVITPVEMVALFSRGAWQREGTDTDLTHDEWLEWTNGLWTFPGESRPWEGHPAPFPIELPRRLIKLLSFRSDTVLDPFVGSGTTVVAAVALGRRCHGYDLSTDFIASAKRRLAVGVGT